MRDGLFGSVTSEDHTVYHCALCGVQRLEESACKGDSFCAGKKSRELLGEASDAEGFCVAHDMHQIRNLNVVWSHSIRNRVVTDVSFAAGFSDHSGTIYPRLAAVTLGIHVLEMHVTFSREIFGLDISASITTSELRQLVEGIRFIEKMIANPVDKETVAKEFGKLRSTFSNSIVARKTLANGKALKADDLTLKKPGTCIPVVGGNCSPIEQAGRSRHLDFRG